MTQPELKSDGAGLPLSPAVAPPVVWWLRIEGLAVAALAGLLYARIGASWWLFAALWLAPDVAFVAYLANSRAGYYLYNFAHWYMTPISLALFAMLSGRVLLLPFALIWANHIGVDRLLGYGLKYPSGFGFTHLGRLGSHPREITMTTPTAPHP